MKKYKLLPKSENGLHRIEALRDFSDVKKGDIGGYVESESNLSHLGNAWIYDDTRVYGNARVSGDAEVYGDARVFGSAKVYGDARVFGNAEVYGDARVFGSARVFGFAIVSGNARVFGNIQTSKTGNILVFQNVGSENGILIAVLSERDNVIYINRGCFYGDIDEFENAVDHTHGDSGYGVEYKALIQYIKLRLS